MLLNAPPIVFFGGKGGVGKTTLAAAHAVALADAGERVLAVSTDPAHSLGDALETALESEPRQVAANLWAAEPDGAAAVRRRVREVTEDAYAAVPREIMPAVKRHLEHAAAGPGMEESALASELMALMERVPGEWDRLVVDSAPTGHLLRMLNLPALLTPWIRGLARQRERAAGADRLLASGVADADAEDDPLLERLHARRLKIERAAARLQSGAHVRLVVVPRRMVLAETQRAARQLREGGFPLGPVVVNQIPEEPDAAALAAVREEFAGYGLVEVPMLEREPTGIDALRALASGGAAA